MHFFQFFLLIITTTRYASDKIVSNQILHQSITCSPFTSQDPKPTILITGGLGFIGSHLVKKLKESKIQSVKIIDSSGM
jgi:FlaA1/EpsC-like NDP-sugar epimerase